MRTTQILFLVLTAVSAAFAASTGREVVERDSAVALDNCNGSINSCFINGCEGAFPTPSSTLGTCTAGKFNGCPCEKCGKKNGSCSQNGCEGFQGTCTAGQFQGCPCS